MNAQFKKGVLELCVLATLDKKDCYGYEMVYEISKNISISEGTIYPLLKRLKKDGSSDFVPERVPRGSFKKVLQNYGLRKTKKRKTSCRME